MIRAGFVLNVAEERWLGGQAYFKNLFTALANLPERRVEAIALTGSGIPSSFGLQSVPQATPACLRKGSPKWLLRRIMRRFSERDVLLEAALHAAQIDVLSHSGHLGPTSRIATLPWIPDFQHVHMPAFFSPAELARRDAHLSRLCRYATRLIVSSECAQADLKVFCSEAVWKSRVLRFVADVPDPDRLPARGSLEEKYRIARPYLFLPNQFWAHKNHRLVLDSLAILKKRGTTASVVASGTTHDDRNPGYFEELMQYARSLGVKDEFKVLGVIPKADVMGLMWHSRAVINPSRFEGWSTTVEEAKSMGVRVLLSDIAVHREQAPPGAAWFHPDDAEALASLMHGLLRDEDPQEKRMLADKARAMLPSRRAAFARLFEDFVLECHQASRAGGRPGVQ